MFNNVSLPGRSMRRTAFGIGMSLLVHALLLLVVMKSPPDIEGGPALPEPSPITLLLPPMPAPVPKKQAQVIPPTPIAQVRKPQPRPAVAPAKRAAPRPKQAIVQPKPAPYSSPPAIAAIAPPVAPVPPAAARAPEPEMDMTAMIEAARQRRRTAADAAAPSALSTPSGSDIAQANIAHSMQSQSRQRNGTSGIFQIVHKGVRTAQFSFHGWTPGSSRQISQLFEVDAGLQGDIDRAIVRKMIALIRQHYPGDFNWESRRLGRLVVLSARPDDNAALESFLLHEFFSVKG